MNDSDIKYLQFKDKKVKITQLSDGDWYDEQGTKYPAMLFDPGFCGVYPGETGYGDPLRKIACINHDKHFIRLMAGYKDPEVTNGKVFREFTGSILTEMLKSAYVLIAGIPYIIFGGGIGALRWAQLERRLKK